MERIGIIGVGNMGSALASAICRATDPNNVYITDNSPDKVKALISESGCHAATLQEIAQNCEIIVLAVKPQGMQALIKELLPLLKENVKLPLLVSIAAGLSLDKLTQWTQNLPFGIVRMMPNTPALVGKGMLLLCQNNHVSQKALDKLCSLLRHAGKVDLIAESLIDAAGALSGCGPAFVSIVAEALADGAVVCGVPREKALIYAWQTLLGTAELALQTGKHPAVLKDAVCCPAGTTIQGVSAMEAGGVRDALIQAVCAAYRRSLELGKQ